jgi:oligoribonuclease NrnB/cAMP/cGMP phosphodiesterase (DHH superfamily)
MRFTNPTITGEQHATSPKSTLHRSSTGYYRLARYPIGDFFGPVDLGLHIAQRYYTTNIGVGVLAGSIFPGSNRLFVNGYSPTWNSFFISSMGGAGLVFDFLEMYDTQIYQYIKYIQDRDLWKWEFGRFTKTLTEYLFTKYLNKPYQLWVLMNKVNAKEILSKYKVVTTHTTRQIQNIFDRMKEDYNELYVDDEIGNVKVFNSSVYPSELGNMLSDLYKEPVGIYGVSRDKIKISFRSTPESNFTALEIAKKLGGGGHEHASGVIMTKRDFIDRLSID